MHPLLATPFFGSIFVGFIFYQLEEYVMKEIEITAKKLGGVINEGKTKKIFSVKKEPSIVVIDANDIVTSGNGEKSDTIPGKGAWATTTTCNVFKLLNECGIKTAFLGQISETRFVAENCDMIELEVVVRREGHGSHLKRNPNHKKGVLFPKLRVEFYLKTSGKKWGEKDIPIDDPLIRFESAHGKIKGMHLYRPDKPLVAQTPFISIDGFPFKWDQDVLNRMDDMARNVFLILERAWWLEDHRLVDFKLEFGFNTERNLVLGDVVDSDSWRIVKNQQYQDKEVYRQGGDLGDVALKYMNVADLTKRFRLPRQRILLWTGSESDDKGSFIEAHDRFAHEQDCEMVYHTRSMHKQPVQGIAELHNWVQGTPRSDVGCVNTVMIVYVGLSNGAGPTLAPNTHIPVITCSPTVKDFPNDIWSSLSLPSNVPLMTVLSPKNAMLSALGILAIRSPRIYALLRRGVEDRMEDVE